MFLVGCLDEVVGHTGKVALAGISQKAAHFLVGGAVIGLQCSAARIGTMGRN